MHGQPRLILASRSPRRAELLSRLGLDFTIIPAEIDETYLPGESPPRHAERLAAEKASAIAAAHHHALVIGSDTIVVVDGDVLGKPKDSDSAAGMLRRLSGREHEVYSGIAIAIDGALYSGVERVNVRFRRLADEMPEQYVATGEPMDKAGAYGIQGYGSALVESISGDYFAVMGLPVTRMLALMERAGWRYTFSSEFVRLSGGDAS